MTNHSIRKAVLLVPMFLASTCLTVFAADVTSTGLLNPDKEPQNWLMVNKDYGSHRYSELDQINKDNAKNLHVA
jgi:glucose dehydrogenase